MPGGARKRRTPPGTDRPPTDGPPAMPCPLTGVLPNPSSLCFNPVCSMRVFTHRIMGITHHGCTPPSPGSRLTTIGSCELRTITHCEGVSGDGLISWCGTKGGT